MVTISIFYRVICVTAQRSKFIIGRCINTTPWISARISNVSYATSITKCMSVSSTFIIIISAFASLVGDMLAVSVAILSCSEK